MHCTYEDLQMTQCIKFNGLPENIRFRLKSVFKVTRNMQLRNVVVITVQIIFWNR